MPTLAATALIAEDEPLLAAALQAELQRAWPGLRVLATVGNGTAAVEQALALKPEVLFFDIRMPGLSGLEAAAELADAWDARAGAPPFPALVFITAYDQYAVQAFETHAIDYVMKPVQPARLRKTVEKLQALLALRRAPAGGSAATPDVALASAPASSLPDGMEATLAQLRQLLASGVAGPAGGAAHGASGGGAASAAPLRMIQASVGNAIRMVPVDEVLYFEAADKYVRVLTAAHEYLIRTPLKELLPQLDERAFWQIHRGTVVRAAAIDSVTRDEAGKVTLTLRGRSDRLVVSRLYAHLFKAM
jgi:DNA-binding LytR/AlgR family response regulator